MTTATRQAPTADQLKAKAIESLHQAVLHIAEARSALCNLEGHGYCSIYERCITHLDAVSREAAILRRLAPPTGVFTL